MKKYFYPALFSKEGNTFNVKFIDFEDIFTFGDSLADAYYIPQDALYNMLPEYKEKLPKPTFAYMKIKVKPNEFITMVELDVKEHEKKYHLKQKWLKNLADSKEFIIK